MSFSSLPRRFILGYGRSSNDIGMVHGGSTLASGSVRSLHGFCGSELGRSFCKRNERPYCGNVSECIFTRGFVGSPSKSRNKVGSCGFFYFGKGPRVVFVTASHTASIGFSFFSVSFGRLSVAGVRPRSKGMVRGPRGFSRVGLLTRGLSRNVGFIEVSLFRLNKGVCFDRFAFFRNKKFGHFCPIR